MSSESLLLTKKEQWGVLSKHSFDFHSQECGSVIRRCAAESITVVNEGFWRRTWLAQWGRRRILDPLIVILSRMAIAFAYNVQHRLLFPKRDRMPSLGASDATLYTGVTLPSPQTHEARGLEPKLLSLSAALGLTLGVFPICGLTVGLCAIAAVLLRSNCHWLTLILGNFIVTPFQLGLVLPFMRVGELVTNGHHFPFTLKGVWDALRGCASWDVLFGVLHAVIGWSIFAPVCFSLFFVIFFPIFRCLLSRFGPSATTLTTVGEVSD